MRIGSNARQSADVLSLPALHFIGIQGNMKTDEDWAVWVSAAGPPPRLEEAALHPDTQQDDTSEAPEHLDLSALPPAETD